MRLIDWLLVVPMLGVGVAACSGQDALTAPAPVEQSAESELGASPIEDVGRYQDCLLHGVGNGLANPGRLTEGDPGRRHMFFVAECVISKIADEQKRTYDLQSLKTTPAGQTFILKQTSLRTIGEPPQECVKIKLSAAVGATNVFVTIQRVKRLPPQAVATLCSDNGET